jgi:excisionase family DNA binding protein
MSAKAKTVVPLNQRILVDYDGAAGLLSIGRRAVEQLVADGELLGIRGITNKVLIERVDLEAYAARKKASSA